MMKRAIAAATGCFVVLGLTVPVFADTSTPLNAKSIVAQAETLIQTATQENQSEWSAYQTLVGQVSTLLNATKTGGSLPSSFKADTTTIEADFTSLSQATTIQAAKTALSQLEKDTKKLQESISSGSSDGQTEREHSLSNAVTKSDKKLKQWIAKANAQAASLQSEASSVSSTSTNEQVKRVANDTRKLGNTEDKVKREFAKWEQKLQSDAKRISAGFKGSSGQQQTTSTSGGSGGSNTNPPTPPAPPSAP